MAEKRQNWKENVSKQAGEKAAQREALQIRLNLVNRALRGKFIDFRVYDELKAQQAELMAKLATL